MARIAGKLTAKSLGWDRNAIGAAVKRVPQDTGRVYLGRVVGIVNGLHQTVNDETGEVQTGLKGQFRGVSSMNELVPVMNGDKPQRDDRDNIVMRDTGQKLTTTAGRCYLPGGLQEMVEGGLAQAQEADANATVTFGFDLFALPATNKAGYTFDADTVVETGAADPLDLLLSQAASAAALPAPTGDTAGTPLDGQSEGTPHEQHPNQREHDTTAKAKEPASTGDAVETTGAAGSASNKAGSAVPGKGGKPGHQHAAG